MGKQCEYLSTIMPKPLFADNASGMHVHQSLWKKDKPMFYDPDEEYTFKIEKRI